MAVAFEIDLAHGSCVGVRFGADADLAALHPDEAAHAATLAPRVRVAWAGGRVALRAAAARVGVSLGAILATPRGAPSLPAQIAGSISHKETIAVALAARADGATRGIDVERDVVRKVDIARKILRDEELAEIAPLAPEARAREVLLRFSLKESIYKALDPYVARYVAFHEARVRPRDDGTADASLHLAKDDGAFDLELRWLRRDGLLVTTARIRRR